MSGAILKLMQDETYGVSVQAPNSGLTADVAGKIVTLTATLNSNSWVLTGMADGKSYTCFKMIIAGTWATGVMGEPSITINPYSSPIGWLWYTNNCMVCQGGSWLPLYSAAVTDGDVVYLLAFEF